MTILAMIRFAEPPLAIACLITSLRKYINNPAIIIAAIICGTVIVILNYIPNYTLFP